ncbi:MAG: hypothetical protein ACJ8FU_25400 [Xanthobacteraceae bacterium]
MNDLSFETPAFGGSDEGGRVKGLRVTAQDEARIPAECVALMQALRDQSVYAPMRGHSDFAYTPITRLPVHL